MSTVASARKKSEKKSAADLQRELDSLKESYRKDGITLSVIKRAHKEWKRTTDFLARNKDNTSN